MLVVEVDHGGNLRLGMVLGNYRLVRIIGEGGVGTVYEGEHLRLGRRMALKVLHPDIATAEQVVRFFNEARAVNAIRHPNIIDVEDFVTADTGEHYLIMELLVGEDLRTVISRDGVLPPERVLAIGDQIASALSAIHRAGILHRDLKPDNIYLTKKGDREVAKLLDFGIAKFTSDQEGMTREGMTLGTPEYMPPEQILTGGKPDARADLYSLGMLLYESLAGAPAFTATTTAAILRGHISEKVVPPSHRRGTAIPAVLEAAVMKCLAKEPQHRFQSADELVAALRADRAVSVAKPRKSVELRAERPRPRRALQMLPAFAMAAAALVLHVTKPEAETGPRTSDLGPRPAEIKQPTPVPKAEPQAEARGPKPEVPAAELPAERPLTEIDLTASPEGATILVAGKPLGAAPQHAKLDVSSTPVWIVARWPDGSEAKQSVVPDRPLPAIAFQKPVKQQKVVVAKPKPEPPPVEKKPAPKLGKDDEINPFK